MGSILVFKKTTNCEFIYYRGRVYCCYLMCMPSSLVEESFGKA
ncbi:hypothetical protein MTR67_042823 [Solanum verrucosum]|uniref:Uncharacterized protein n=1 Tax=Solanum verrucosum TaxID=315347 RepID=A0AAF0UQ60_SOLVR|nr:hypothetical protein MTR67_042823 [Solanum verrucosum]